MTEFEKRLIMYGELFLKSESLGKARCEVILNDVDTSSLRAKFSVFEGDLQKAFLAFGNDNGIEFKSNSENETTKIIVDFLGLHLSGINDEIIRGRVREYSCISIRLEGEAQEISIMYRLMPTTLFRTESGMIMKHGRKGLLYGWNGWKKEFHGLMKEGEQEWSPVELELPSEYGPTKVYHNFQFFEEEKNGREQYLIVDTPSVSFKVTSAHKSIENVLPLIEAEMETILLGISFIQGDFVDWTYSNIESYDSNDKSIQKIERYRIARKIDEEKLSDTYITNHSKQLRVTLSNIISSFRGLSASDKIVCKNSMERYIIASRKNTIDTRLIYIHSCLDVLIKNYDTTSDPFSKRLLHVCKSQNVAWNDIYDELTEDDIENKKKDFPVNSLRNNMLHHGEYLEDHQFIMKETDRAKGLSERIILKMLGIDYKSSGLGKKDRFS